MVGGTRTDGALRHSDVERRRVVRQDDDARSPLLRTRCSALAAALVCSALRRGRSAARVRPHVVVLCVCVQVAHVVDAVTAVEQTVSYGAVQERIDAHFARGIRQHEAEDVGEGRYRVSKRSANDASSYIVDKERRTCECGVPQRMGWPCVHVCTAMQSIARPNDVRLFLAYGLRREDLVGAFSARLKTASAPDLQQDDLEVPSALPAASGRPKGAPRKRHSSATARIASSGEKSKRGRKK